MSLSARLAIPIVMGLLFAQFSYNVYLKIGRPYFPVFSQSSPRFVQVLEGFNIVDYKGTFFAVPLGVKVNWQSENYATTHNLKSAPTFNGLLKSLNQVEASNIIDKHMGFAIHKLDGLFVAQPDSLGVPSLVWQDLALSEEKTITANSLAEIKDSIEFYWNGFFEIDVATTIYSDGPLQLVGFKNNIYVVPIGASVDFGARSGVQNPYIKFGSLNEALEQLSQLQRADWYKPIAIQVESFKSHNIVNFAGKYFAIPFGVEFNLAEYDGTLPFWITGSENLDILKDTLASQEFNFFFPNPTEVRTHKFFNIVAYKSDYFAIPLGANFDFLQPSDAYPNWIVRAKSYEDLMALIEAKTFIPFFPDPVLLDTKIPYNIIGAGDKFFAVPYGVEFNDSTVAQSINGPSMEVILKKISEMKKTGYQLPSPVLLKSLSSSNIVGYEDKVYQIPHGLSFDFDSITLPLPFGVLSASSENELYALIERVAVDEG